MYKKKTIDKKYTIIIGMVILSIIIGFIINIVNTTRELTSVEKSIKDTVLLVNKIIYAPVDFVTTKIDEHNEKNDLYNKYKELEKKVDATDLVNAEKKELEKEVGDLKEVLELNTILSDTEYLNATIINRNLGYWYNTITIDKGSNNGVENDMAVIVNKGLIGKVTSTTAYSSNVKLLTSYDVNNKISVKIEAEGEHVYGLLSGYDEDTKTFTVEGISSNKKIEQDAFVTTTGMGDIFPSGIVVGKVSNVVSDNFDLARTVEVTPTVDFDDINYVTILKRKD